MAIEEQGVFTGVADTVHSGGDPDGDATDVAVRAPVPSPDADELRRRLETPLFSRDPSSMPSAQVPGLRELTWDHVTNPTSSIPVVPGESIFGEHGGAPRPSPLTLDEVLPRRDVGLKPMDTDTAVPATPLTPPAGLPSADPSGRVAAMPPPSGPTSIVPPPSGPTAVVPPPSAPTATTSTAEARLAPLQPLPTSSTGAQPAARAPLPSFSDIVASGGASSAGPSGGVTPADAGGEMYARGDTGGVDSLLKPIDEPPPIARETDPLVDGLAELIVRSTPSVGMPRVAELREVSRGDTGVVPSVTAARLDPPVLDAAVEFANMSTSVPVIEGPEPEITTGTHSTVPAAEVEAEMNRLAYLPDQDDSPEGPVEVPAIAYSDVRGADAPPAPTAPSLSTGEVYTPRQSAAPIRHTYADILASTVVPVVRKRKRHVVRKVVSLLLLLGLLGGGMFAVKHFVLDRVQWTADLEPIAKEVETARGLRFDKGVVVEELGADDYAHRLVDAAGYGTEGLALDDAELRALGLANGKVDRAAAGRIAMSDAPAFYDPTDQVIYQLQDLPTELRTFALHRALTMALLDQTFGWSARIVGQPEANLRGTLALYDADALAVANAIVGEDAELRSTLAAQSFELLADNAEAPTPSPFLSIVSSRLGLAAWPYVAALSNDDRNLLETGTLFTDAKVLDIRRLVDGTAEPSSDPDSKGMLFWYHVLASRLSADEAWKIALGWRSDATVTTKTSAGLCTAATLTFDAATHAAVQSGFTAWMLLAPPKSKTNAVIGNPVKGTTTVEITACDPGAGAATTAQAGRLSLGGAPLRTAQVAAALMEDPSADVEAAACAAYGADQVTLDDERSLIDPVLPWARVTAHPAVDTSLPRCAG